MVQEMKDKEEEERTLQWRPDLTSEECRLKYGEIILDNDDM